MKYLVLFFALLVAIGPAVAQAPPAARPDSLSATHAAPDTVAAIHRLFVAKRRQRNLIAGGIVVAALVGVAASPTGAHELFSTGDYAKLYGLAAAAAVGVDFAFSSEFSQRNEQYALEDFRAHQLSKHLRRKLRPRYFR
ncbi:MAG: hypothetical protein ACRYFZ_22100 [Janthinobacterium lividum]